MSALNIHALTMTIDELGIAADESAVAALAAVAADRRLNPVLIDVLVDRTAPEPVRERAFGLLVGSAALAG